MKRPVWLVEDVKPQRDYTLLITFADGSRRLYDARPLLEKELYAMLKNPAFSCARVRNTVPSSGATMWTSPPSICMNAAAVSKNRRRNRTARRSPPPPPL